MSLVSDIQTICATLYPDATFKLASQFNANVRSETIAEAEMPYIVLDNTIRKTNRLEANANTTKRSEIRMYFLDKVNYDITDEAQNTLIEEMELMADRVFNNIYQLDKVSLQNTETQEYTTEPIFKYYNSILSGVMAKAQYRESVIISYCKTP